MKINLFVTFFFFSASCLFGQTIPVKFLQINIWLEGTQVLNGYEGIVNEIIKNDADIVTLNEVINKDHTRFNDRIVRSLKERGKTYFSFYCDDSGILSKYPIIDSASVYPEKADTGNINKAIVKIGKYKIAVYSSHLDYQCYSPYLPRGYNGNTWQKIEKPVTDVDSILSNTLSSKRYNQIKTVINDAANESKKGNVIIIGGDFNEPSHLDWTASTRDLFDHHGMVIPWPVSKILYQSGYVDAYRYLYPNPVTHPGFTYPADNPAANVKALTWAPEADERERIDFIYFKPAKDLVLKQVSILGPKGCIVKNKREEEKSMDHFIPPSGTWPSDHKAVFAVFELNSKK